MRRIAKILFRTGFSVRSGSDGDAGEGNLQVVGLQAALNVRDGVAEVLFNLLGLLGLLQVGELFLDLLDELWNGNNYEWLLSNHCIV